MTSGLRVRVTLKGKVHSGVVEEVDAPMSAIHLLLDDHSPRRVVASPAMIYGVMLNGKLVITQ